MALSILQILGLTGLAVGSGVVVTRSVRATRAAAKASQLGVPACGEGTTARLVDGQWQCLPVTAFEQCLEGIVVHDRLPLPASIEQDLPENARKTAEQFFGFHLTAEAMEEAWAALVQAIDAGEEEESYYAVLANLMPCNWPLWAPGGDPDPGFTFAPNEHLAGWPLDFNYYLDPPDGVSDRMQKGARSLFDLFIVAISRKLDQFLPLDVDPISLISDPERDACAKADVLPMRAPGVDTSYAVIKGALFQGGYEPEEGGVVEILEHLEHENPLLIEHLRAPWHVSEEVQDRLWSVLLEVGDFPRPITNTVYNLQSGSCPWEEKDRYSLSMATLWYAAKRMAAIAELSGLKIPVVVKEG